MAFSVVALLSMTFKQSEEPLSTSARIALIGIALLVSLVIAIVLDRTACFVGGDYFASFAEASQVFLVFLIAGVAGRVAQTGVLLS
mmetsp:Transcript_19570/g.45500  ORF Transcript_19570/g.45500 Transcript_19570/m.45500 type:complete len:86 (-) Transcript_19570:320-577(-)